MTPQRGSSCTVVSADSTSTPIVRRGESVQPPEIDRTPKPCLHKVADHQHGTRACYVLDKCRCIPCKDANRQTEKHRQRQKLYGRWEPYVDAEPVRQHMMALRAQGLGPKRVATLSGVPHGSLAKLIYGAPERGMAPSKRVRRETAERILAVTADLANLGARTNTDSFGAVRRLQALVAAGWSQSKLAHELGILPSNFTPVMKGRRCSARTALAVRDLYDRLAFTAPPEASHRDKIAASRARRHASSQGWPPPMWWDPEDLDDPAFVVVYQPRVAEDVGGKDDVDPIAVDLAVSGEQVKLTVAERREVVRRLHALGMTDQDIRRHVGISDRTALRIRQELGLPAIRAAA